MDFTPKKFAVGVVMTGLTIAVLFFVLNRFAPDGVKQFFRVS